MFGRWLDARFRRKEPEHVKFYSTVEYTTMFEAAALKAAMSRTIWPPLKAHIAER
jgi:hypothetical protein